MLNDKPSSWLVHVCVFVHVCVCVFIQWRGWGHLLSITHTPSARNFGATRLGSVSIGPEDQRLRLCVLLQIELRAAIPPTFIAIPQIVMMESPRRGAADYISRSPCLPFISGVLLAGRAATNSRGAAIRLPSHCSYGRGPLRYTRLTTWHLNFTHVSMAGA